VTKLLLNRRNVLVQGAALGASAMAPGAGAQPPKGLVFAGVNIAGAEFGKPAGMLGKDYIYPGHDSIDRWAGLGFNLIRVPLRWERLQPDLNGPLKDKELAELRRVVEHAQRRSVAVLLDPHNYGGRRLAEDDWQSGHLIGSRELPISAFADFWRRLAAEFGKRHGILFGLMNEPAKLQPSDWLKSVDAAIAAIRAEGAGNLILVPGIAYTGAHSWLTSGNTLMENVQDPARNFAIEVHQYLDRDSSGTHDEAVSPTIGSERIKGFVAWARQRRLRAVLGEFGASADTQSLAALQDLCQAMHATPDVWLGWAAWAAGAWWPKDYRFNLEPLQDGSLRPQTRILSTFARSVSG